MDIRHPTTPLRKRSQCNFLASSMLASIAVVIGGCAIAPAPLKDTPRIVATPTSGQLTVSTEPVKAIGDVLPVYVSVANGTDSPRAIVPSQIFALNDAGSRIAPLPPAEAARQAGGAGELRAALLSAGASGLIEGAFGAGLGAIAGSLIHSGGTGAAIGGAISPPEHPRRTAATILANAVRARRVRTVATIQLPSEWRTAICQP